MQLLGDVVMWNVTYFSLEIVLVSVHDLRQTYHRLRNHFGRTRWYHYVTRLKWKLVSVLLDIVLILTQDRCMVCVERTNRLKNYFGRTRWNS